jgi:hypothetical protein
VFAPADFDERFAVSEAVTDLCGDGLGIGGRPIGIDVWLLCYGGRWTGSLGFVELGPDDGVGGLRLGSMSLQPASW